MQRAIVLPENARARGVHFLQDRWGEICRQPARVAAQMGDALLILRGMLILERLENLASSRLYFCNPLIISASSTGIMRTLCILFISLGPEIILALPRAVW
jgi:hypothetical protein